MYWGRARATPTMGEAGCISRLCGAVLDVDHDYTKLERFNTTCAISGMMKGLVAGTHVMLRSTRRSTLWETKVDHTTEYIATFGTCHNIVVMWRVSIATHI